VCDLDGSELYQRDDDKAETVTRRIQVYFAQTAPLIAYYRERGVLSEIDGAQPINKVSAELLAVLGK
jgi:adenylate kinase